MTSLQRWDPEQSQRWQLLRYDWPVWVQGLSLEKEGEEDDGTLYGLRSDLNVDTGDKKYNFKYVQTTDCMDTRGNWLSTQVDLSCFVSYWHLFLVVLILFLRAKLEILIMFDLPD